MNGTIEDGRHIFPQICSIHIHIYLLNILQRYISKKKNVANLLNILRKRIAHLHRIVAMDGGCRLPGTSVTTLTHNGMSRPRR
jgi:hypothetical protein